jgi:hypothetical protein
MSRRGAGSGLAHKLEQSERFDYVPAPALARPVLEVAKQLLEMGLSSAEVCSLFSHAASTLAHQDDGLPREEWLALCAELYDADEVETAPVLTSRGGSA